MDTDLKWTKTGNYRQKDVGMDHQWLGSYAEWWGKLLNVIWITNVAKTTRQYEQMIPAAHKKQRRPQFLGTVRLKTMQGTYNEIWLTIETRVVVMAQNHVSAKGIQPTNTSGVATGMKSSS